MGETEDGTKIKKTRKYADKVINRPSGRFLHSVTKQNRKERAGFSALVSVTGLEEDE